LPGLRALPGPRPIIVTLVVYLLMVATAVWWSLLPARPEAGLRQTYQAQPADRAEPIRFEQTTPGIDLTLLDEQPELPGRFFSVRWDGFWYQPATSFVDFYAGGDDRVRILIDGESVIERDADVGMHTTSERVLLHAGVHAVEIVYEQYGGGRHLNIQWAPGGKAPTRLPAVLLFPEQPDRAQLGRLARAYRWRALLPVVLLGPPFLVALLVWGPRVSHRAHTAFRRDAGDASDPDSAVWRVPGLNGIHQHPGWCLLGVVALGIAVRILLAYGSPIAFGYVYDPYHAPVELLYLRGSLPGSPECWQCYHPPVFYYLGLPFYAVGMWVSRQDREVGLGVLALLATVCGASAAYYGYRLLTLFSFGGIALVGGATIVLMAPVLVLSSYGAAADVVLAAVMIAFVYYLTRYQAERAVAPLGVAVIVGLLAGLAMATNYSGLIAIVVAGQLIAVHLALGPSRLRAVRNGLIILGVCLSVGSWKYVDNLDKYDTALFANGSAQEGFGGDSRERFKDRYDFTSFELGEILALTRPDAPDGGITYLPVYGSVWTTLYAQIWGDMSFFTNPTRGGIDRAYVW
jgi:hypothetical protein